MRPAHAIAPDFTVSVSRLANYLNRKLAADSKLRRIGVSGEISGFSAQPNGTMYFDLKDRDALINCVAWSEAAAAFPPLANGLAVVAVGSIGTYKKKSTYQLTVYAVELEGAGRLHALYEALRRRLDADGLFALARKRALPAFPFRIALVSSRAANGAGDFMAQAAALAPHVTIELFETPVQGASAAPLIERAIDRASRSPADIVVLARGGGSYEDLFVFNDERVVRALARCAHPTVSAIGHEADAPLTDFVADCRAATPSTAAQTILPRRADLLHAIALTATRLDRAAGRQVAALRRDVERIEVRSPLAVPERLLAARRQTVDGAAVELHRAVAARVHGRAQLLAAVKARLETANPSVRLSLRRERLAQIGHVLRQTAGEHLRRETLELHELSRRLQASSPNLRLARGRERLALAGVGLMGAARRSQERRSRQYAAAQSGLVPQMQSALVRRRAALALAEAVLDERNPTKILQRGYAIVSAGGKILRDAQSVPPGTEVSAQLARGTLVTRVESARLDGGE